MNFGMLLILEAKLRENLSDLSSKFFHHIPKFFYHIPKLDLKVSWKIHESHKRHT